MAGSDAAFQAGQYLCPLLITAPNLDSKLSTQWKMGESGPRPTFPTTWGHLGLPGVEDSLGIQGMGDAYFVAGGQECSPHTAQAVGHSHRQGRHPAAALPAARL